mmetsp:Transcript_17388/g.41666  ORF Transcript_17388/g.41666 Transcript_17388/m.41666 type:complete len:501 (+) Transcript_17388:2819-4321(+)
MRLKPLEIHQLEFHLDIATRCAIRPLPRGVDNRLPMRTHLQHRLVDAWHHLPRALRERHGLLPRLVDHLALVIANLVPHPHSRLCVRTARVHACRHIVFDELDLDLAVCVWTYDLLDEVEELHLHDQVVTASAVLRGAPQLHTLALVHLRHQESEDRVRMRAGTRAAQRGGGGLVHLAEAEGEGGALVQQPLGELRGDLERDGHLVAFVWRLVALAAAEHPLDRRAVLRRGDILRRGVRHELQPDLDVRARRHAQLGLALLAVGPRGVHHHLVHLALAHLPDGAVDEERHQRPRGAPRLLRRPKYELHELGRLEGSHGFAFVVEHLPLPSHLHLVSFCDIAHELGQLQDLRLDGAGLVLEDVVHLEQLHLVLDEGVGRYAERRVPFLPKRHLVVQARQRPLAFAHRVHHHPQALGERWVVRIYRPGLRGKLVVEDRPCGGESALVAQLHLAPRRGGGQTLPRREKLLQRVTRRLALGEVARAVDHDPLVVGAEHRRTVRV